LSYATNKTNFYSINFRKHFQNIRRFKTVIMGLQYSLY